MPVVESLTIQDKFFIEHNKNLGVEELAKIMNRPASQIEDELRILEQKEFEQEKVAVAENPEREITTVKKNSPLFNAFARRKEGGVTIMTGTAAQLSDEIEKERGKKSLLESQKDSLTTVRK